MENTTDWFHVEAVANGWRQITEGDPILPCHMFVVEDKDDAVLIDTGLGISDLSGLVSDLVGTADVPVLLTHSHWDHIGGADQFDQIAIHDRERTADGRVTLDVLSDEFSHRSSAFIENCIEHGVAFPDKFDPETYTIDPATDIDPLEPWAEISVGDRTLETIPVPGHSPGQLAILDRTARICHGADILEPDGKILAHFEDCDLNDYRESIDRLVELRDEGAYDTLTIGHGDPIRGDDLSVLDEIKDALDRIDAGDVDFENTDTKYGPTRRYEIRDLVFLTKP